MPDKDNENKFMAMLEKMGMVRKLDSDEESEQEFGESENRKIQSYDSVKDDFPKNSSSRSDDILSSSFSSAHQPVPGMPDPVLPAEKPKNEAYNPNNTFDEPRSYDTHIGFDESDTFDDPADFDEPEPYAEPRPVQKADSGRSAYKFDQSFWDESADSSSKGLPIEAYTDRFVDPEELYSVFSMKTHGTDTVYLIEEYLKTLPDSLPDDSRRDIIIKIIAASGFSYDIIMGDGVARVGKLKEYAEQFAQRTEEYIASRSAELESLERQIQKIRGMIERRRELHKKQFFSIEAEAQRLKELLSFLSD